MPCSCFMDHDGVIVHLFVEKKKMGIKSHPAALNLSQFTLTLLLHLIKGHSRGEFFLFVCLLCGGLFTKGVFVYWYLTF